MSARDTALSVLIACRTKAAWSDGTLKEYIARDGLDRRDAALASQLTYGVLQNRMLLDDWIGRFLNCKIEKLQPVVTDILRLAVFQMKFLDKIPASAAVNEAVSQCKRHANPRAAGLVNAVLRSMLREPEKPGVPEDLSIRYSHPAPLVALLKDSIGDEHIEAFLQCDNEAPKTCVQINTLCCDTATAEERLAAEGFHTERHPWLSDCLLISGGSIEHTELFTSGSVYVQDAAAKLAAVCSGVQPGDRVLDCCSAPGGKSFACAIQMQNTGSIVSCDLHAHKTKLIEKGTERLGLSIIRAIQADASAFREEFSGAFDVVIADVPCSGFGVIRKKPDIRYKDVSETEKLPAIQLRILNTQAGYVKPGGVLLYSTCTVLKRENEDVCTAFLQAHPEYSAELLPLPEMFGKKTNLTLLPYEYGTDGFFIAKFRRNA